MHILIQPVLSNEDEVSCTRARVTRRRYDVNPKTGEHAMWVILEAKTSVLYPNK